MKERKKMRKKKKKKKNPEHKKNSEKIMQTILRGLQADVSLVCFVIDVEVVVVRTSDHKSARGKEILGEPEEKSKREEKEKKPHCPSPLKLHSNLSKMQSFSYKSQSFLLEKKRV